MRKLSEIELTIIVAGLEIGINSPTATTDEKKVLSEMLTLSQELIVKWDNVKSQKLWTLSASKVLTESPDFVKDTNGAKCVIDATLEKVKAIAVNAAIAALTTPTAPNTPATTAAPAAPATSTPSDSTSYYS